MENGECSTSEVLEWLINGARPATDMSSVLSELCVRLLHCGIPIERVGLFVLTLHPHVMGQRFLWKSGSPVEVNNAPIEAFQTPEFEKSPVRRVIETGAPVRRRLADKDCPIDLTMLSQLRDQGVTDYVAVPLIFANGTVHGATFASRDPGGFNQKQIQDLASIAAPLSRVVENRTLQRTASALLDTYVGHKGGERILAGQIKRGHLDTMDAVIWFSDMRGFTSLSDHLEPQALVDLLNRYFDCQVPSILDRGGEVLEFMGDGLLAVFLTATDGGNARRVCETALAAARDARAAVARLSARYRDRERLHGSQGHHLSGVHFGLALHLGQVSYGNIGSRNRLKFTCVGAAMNLTSRIEALTSPLGRTILASTEFAQQCPSQFVPIGEFDLKGFATARTVFGLQDETKQGVDHPTPS